MTPDRTEPETRCAPEAAVTTEEGEILAGLDIVDIEYRIRQTEFECTHETHGTDHAARRAKLRITIVCREGADPDEVLAKLSPEALANVRPHVRTALLAMQAQAALIAATEDRGGRSVH